MTKLSTNAASKFFNCLIIEQVYYTRRISRNIIPISLQIDVVEGTWPQLRPHELHRQF